MPNMHIVVLANHGSTCRLYTCILIEHKDFLDNEEMKSLKANITQKQQLDGNARVSAELVVEIDYNF